jgi:hypothetical protein
MLDFIFFRCFSTGGVRPFSTGVNGSKLFPPREPESAIFFTEYRTGPFIH